jgi:hypothetical protein
MLSVEQENVYGAAMADGVQCHFVPSGEPECAGTFCRRPESNSGATLHAPAIQLLSSTIFTVLVGCFLCAFLAIILFAAILMVAIGEEAPDKTLAAALPPPVDQYEEIKRQPLSLHLLKEKGIRGQTMNTEQKWRERNRRRLPEEAQFAAVSFPSARRPL